MNRNLNHARIHQLYGGTIGTNLSWCESVELMVHLHIATCCSGVNIVRLLNGEKHIINFLLSALEPFEKHSRVESIIYLSNVAE